MLYLTFHIDDTDTEKIKAWRPLEDNPGDFVFTFTPTGDGCRVEVRHDGDPDTHDVETATLTLDLDHCLHVNDDPNDISDAFRWRTPQFLGPATAEQAIGVNEIVFWIDGEMMQRLEAAGWNAERAGAFQYRFRLHGDEPDIWVHDRESGEEHRLTG